MINPQHVQQIVEKREVMRLRATLAEIHQRAEQALARTCVDRSDVALIRDTAGSSLAKRRAANENLQVA